MAPHLAEGPLHVFLVPKRFGLHRFAFLGGSRFERFLLRKENAKSFLESSRCLLVLSKTGFGAARGELSFCLGGNPGRCLVVPNSALWQGSGFWVLIVDFVFGILEFNRVLGLTIWLGVFDCCFGNTDSSSRPGPD